jgi:5-methylcytosine-specific restriction endonuclease McrA
MFELRPVEKPNHKRRVQKRVDRGKFSRKTIQEILERDEYKCVRCGSYQVEAVPHHIIYKSQGGLGEKRNGVTICRDCHTWAHNSKKKNNVWFEKYRDKNFDPEGNRL